MQVYKQQQKFSVVAPFRLFQIVKEQVRVHIRNLPILVVEDKKRKLTGFFRFLSSKFRRCGGARRDRTDDLLNANQALSQLSYGP